MPGIQDDGVGRIVCCPPVVEIQYPFSIGSRNVRVVEKKGIVCINFKAEAQRIGQIIDVKTQRLQTIQITEHADAVDVVLHYQAGILHYCHTSIRGDKRKLFAPPVGKKRMFHQDTE